MIPQDRVMGAMDRWGMGVLDGDVSPQRSSALRAARWGLIALCGGIILLSNNMSGRLGFAALLLLAVIVGRYAARRRTRVLETETHLPSPALPAAPPPAADADLPRREAGH